MSFSACGAGSVAPARLGLVAEGEAVFTELSFSHVTKSLRRRHLEELWAEAERMLRPIAHPASRSCSVECLWFGSGSVGLSWSSGRGELQRAEPVFQELQQVVDGWKLVAGNLLLPQIERCSGHVLRHYINQDGVPGRRVDSMDMESADAFAGGVE